MLGSRSIIDMDKVTIQCGSLRKSYDIFSLPSQMYDFMEKEGFCLPRRKTITDVPNEILTSIFQHLDRKSLISVLSVCQRFFDHGAPLLWSTVLCCEGISQDDEDGFHLPKLLAKALSNTATSRSYELFIKKFNITAMDSSSLCGSIEHLVGSIPKMSNLTHLEVAIRTSDEESPVFGRIRSTISLTFVELMKLPRLEVLNVEPLDLEIVCHFLETEYKFSLENATIAKMLLGHLIIPVSDGHFQQFIRSFKALEALELWGISTLSTSLWAELLSSETITHLEVNCGDFEISDNPSVLLSSSLKSLLLYDIYSESETLRVFLSPMSLLTRLELHACHISDIGEVSPIADVIRQLECFSYFSMPDTIAPLVCRGFADPCSKLRKLSIELSLADESVLREFMGIPTLEEVRFNESEVSPTSLAEFFQSNTALRHVELGHYPLDPSYLLPLLQSCPNIETFTTFERVEKSVQILDKMVKNHSNLRLPIFRLNGLHSFKIKDLEDYLRIFPRLANHVKFSYL